MSEVNPFDLVNYLEQARSRYTQQFKGKEVFDKFVQLLLYGQGEAQLVLKDLMQNRSLDKAEGFQLDLLGAIVGLSRGSLPSEIWNESYFGFADDASALPFADLNTVDDAGLFFDLASQTEGNVEWDDPTYRMFLKAKIYANTSNATPNELIAATKAILNVSFVDLIELGNAQLLISFDRLLNPVEKYILEGLGETEGLLPIPIGVGVGFIEADEEFFGFEETPGALGFSSFEEVAEEEGYGENYGESYGGGTAPTTVEVGGGYFASLF